MTEWRILQEILGRQQGGHIDRSGQAKPPCNPSCSADCNQLTAALKRPEAWRSGTGTDRVECLDGKVDVLLVATAPLAIAGTGAGVCDLDDH
jgi:hypothetical protein